MEWRYSVGRHSPTLSSFEATQGGPEQEEDEKQARNKSAGVRSAIASITDCLNVRESSSLKPSMRIFCVSHFHYSVSIFLLSEIDFMRIHYSFIGGRKSGQMYRSCGCASPEPGNRSCLNTAPKRMNQNMKYERGQRRSSPQHSS